MRKKETNVSLISATKSEARSLIEFLSIREKFKGETLAKYSSMNKIIFDKVGK